jgi:hypothetical protein
MREEVLAVVKKYLPASKRSEAVFRAVERVRYGGDLCGSFSLFGDPGVSAIAPIGAYFEPDAQGGNVKLCRGLLDATTSRFALANAIAHEITHSIDPCTISEKDPTAPKKFASRKQMDEWGPWADAVLCLRGRKSVGALSFQNSFQAKHCREDQIVEALPDLIASQVVGRLVEESWFGAGGPDELLKGIANIWRFACPTGKPTVEKDPHSSTRVRMERLIALQPAVRKALQCGPVPKGEVYCGYPGQEAQ